MPRDTKDVSAYLAVNAEVKLDSTKRARGQTRFFFNCFRVREHLLFSLTCAPFSFSLSSIYLYGSLFLSSLYLSGSLFLSLFESLPSPQKEKKRKKKIPKKQERISVSSTLVAQAFTQAFDYIGAYTPWVGPDIPTHRAGF